MSPYRVKFFKNLLSSDGHPFKCIQHTVEVRRARSADRALKAAQCRFERLRHIHDWKVYADLIELETAEKMVDQRPAA